MGIYRVIVLLSLLLTVPLWADNGATPNPPLGLQDEGGAVSYPVYQLDCVGTDISCTQAGITGTITTTAATASTGWTDDGTVVRLTTATDRVGMGTTSPNGALQLHATLSPVFLQITNGDTDTTNADGGKFQMNGAVMSLLNYELGQMSFYTNATEYMRLSSTGGLSVGNAYVGTNPGAGSLIISGSLGVGDATPDATLDVAGTFQFDGNGVLGDASGDTVTANAAAWTLANDTTVALTGGVNGINFDSNTLSIDAANNRVGLGTASPGQVLDVEGNIQANQFVGVAHATNPYMELSETTGTVRTYYFQVGATANLTEDFSINLSGNPGQFVLKTTGSVGLNDETPDARFEVNNGSTAQSIFIASDGDTPVLTVADGGIVTLTNALTLTPLASAPSSPASGMLYMDSTPAPDELCVYDGTGWQALITGTDANCA